MPLPSPTAAPHIDLNDRVVLITGAAGGLGRPLAIACAARGATVVLHGRVVRKLEALYDAIVAAGSPQPTIMPLDFATANAADFDATAGAIRAQLGRLDALVHTAAFLGSLGPLEHQAPDAWSKAYAVNVGAAMALTRACMSLLARSLDASIVFTLDTRGLDPRAYWGGYAATKAAVAALAATLADEVDNRRPHSRERRRSRPDALAAAPADASRRRSRGAAVAGVDRSAVFASDRRPAESGKRHANRRARMACRSARRDAARVRIGCHTPVTKV